MKKYKIHIGIAVGSVIWLILNSICVLDVAQALYMEGEMAAIDAMQWGLFLSMPITIFSSLVACFVILAIRDFIEEK